MASIMLKEWLPVTHLMLCRLDLFVSNIPSKTHNSLIQSLLRLLGFWSHSPHRWWSSMMNGGRTVHGLVMIALLWQSHIDTLVVVKRKLLLLAWRQEPMLWPCNSGGQYGLVLLLIVVVDCCWMWAKTVYRTKASSLAWSPQLASRWPDHGQSLLEQTINRWII